MKSKFDYLRIFLLLAVPLSVGAVFEWEVPLPPAPGGGTLSETSLDSLFTYIYNFGLGLGGLFAFIKLIDAGIKWGAEGAGVTQKSAALEEIKNTLFGLLLLLFSWVILNTINPQILNLNLKVSRANSETTESAHGLAGIFNSLTNSAQRKSLDELLQNISREYLIQVKQTQVKPLSLKDKERRPAEFCGGVSSTDPVCARDCTEANIPCDFYRAKCAGETPDGWNPACPLPPDPDCRSGAGGKVNVCTLVGDWAPDFENKNCRYNEIGLPKPELGGGGFGAPDDYRTYLVEASNFFGIPPTLLVGTMLSESEGLLFDSEEGIAPSYIQFSAAPGGYIGLIDPNSPPSDTNDDWCQPNSKGAVGPMALTIKSCGISGDSKKKCTWQEYCKFRNAANQIRHDWGYKPNPSNILDAFAITAKLDKFFMDDGFEGEFIGMLNDTLKYGYGFSKCPNRAEVLRWNPPNIINPIVFYAIGHFYYGDCLSDYSEVPRYLDPNQMPIDTSSYYSWAQINQPKIMHVRNRFLAALQALGYMPEGFRVNPGVTTPTYCDFLWWYFDMHAPPS